MVLSNKGEPSSNGLTLLLAAAAAASAVSQTNKLPKRRSPRFVISPYLQKRKRKGRFRKDFQDMKDYPPEFRHIFRLTPAHFEELLGMIEHRLKPKRRARPDSYKADEKLAMTLEYLASGSYQNKLASVYRASKQSFGRIVKRTCQAIYEELGPITMKELSKEDWLQVANDFNVRWNLPNCLGAVDGKHIEIIKPKNSGSLYYNYKGFFSIVLIGICDAQYRFTFVDIGAYGSDGDSDVFRRSAFGKQLVNDKLPLPPDAPVSGIKTPFFFIGDDAFPLTTRIMKPYSPSQKKQLDDDEHIFNYRLSRARRCIENAFGILCARWRVLARLVPVNPSHAKIITAACCVLHNYLMHKDRRDTYCPRGFCDRYDGNGDVIYGRWRLRVPRTNHLHIPLQPVPKGRSSDVPKGIRDRIKYYVNSDQGSVSWQRDQVLTLRHS